MDKFLHCIDRFVAWLGTIDLYETVLKSLERFLSVLETWNIAELSTTAATSFALIAAAEIGDKSQLVCMTLASRHRPMPVLWGAVAAFGFLNSLAVVFGVAISHWLPELVVTAAVAILFAGFGLHSLRAGNGEDDEEDVKEKSGHGIFLTTFLLITVAEFGDKTQLAVVALSSASLPLGVWLGSTAALIFTSTLGILAGRTILQKFPLTLLHKISGVIFIILSVLTAYRGYLNYGVS